MLPPLTRLLRRGPRHFSISQPPTLTAKHSIYVSQSTDPYFNLSFEDWYASSSGILPLRSLELEHNILQVIQGEVDSGATPAHLP
jgi:hypothetical protein